MAKNVLVLLKALNKEIYTAALDDACHALRIAMGLLADGDAVDELIAEFRKQLQEQWGITDEGDTNAGPEKENG